MSTPYFDRVITRAELQKLLSSVKAEHSPARSKPGAAVYKVEGGGEGMVTREGEKYRLRLYRGKCAC